MKRRGLHDAIRPLFHHLESNQSCNGDIPSTSTMVQVAKLRFSRERDARLFTFETINDKTKPRSAGCIERSVGASRTGSSRSTGIPAARPESCWAPPTSANMDDLAVSTGPDPGEVAHLKRLKTGVKELRTNRRSPLLLAPGCLLRLCAC